MLGRSDRRAFLSKSLGYGALAAGGEFAFLRHLTPLSAAQVQVRPLAAVAPDIEPLVRFIEDTPRPRLVQETAQRIRQGTSYEQLLSALMLAGVRGIQPRPVGFKFHAVLVVNSAHLATLAAADRDRWLPLFWSLDNFKSSQERNRREGDWRMAPAAEELPAPHQARERFLQAMNEWDETGADRAVTAWARCGTLEEVYAPFWRLGARDFRSIGHKAIFVANSYRTLQTIGWRHGEPIVRSLAYALLYHDGANPARRDDEADRDGRENLQRLTRIRRGWQRGRAPREAAGDFLAALRQANPAEACDQVVRRLNEEVDPACLWDGIFLRAGELLLRQPGIVGLHVVTTANALHFGYATTGDDETRRYLLLQAAAFLPHFQAAMQRRGPWRRDTNLDALEPLACTTRGAERVGEIFADVGRDTLAAARKTLTLLNEEPAAAGPLLAQARRLIFAKGNDSHDYKFSSAALEDYYHATPAWRNRFLAASMFNLTGASAPDTPLLARTREAFGA